MIEPMWKRLCRHADPGHVDKLVTAFKNCRDGPYTILAVHIVGVAPADFNKRNLQGYTYEVIGGNHTRLALQKLLAEDPSADAYRNVRARVYCDLSDSLAKRVGMDHNNIHFALESTSADRLFTFRAAAYAEAGYTNEADLTTVDLTPSQKKQIEDPWKDGLVTMLAVVPTVKASRRRRLTNLYGLETRLATASCRVWNKLCEFVEKWQQGGILKQPKGSRILRTCNLKFLDGKDEEKKMELLQKLLNGDLEYGFDNESQDKGKKKKQKRAMEMSRDSAVAGAGVPAPVPGTSSPERAPEGEEDKVSPSSADTSDGKDAVIDKQAAELQTLRAKLASLKESYKKKEMELRAAHDQLEEARADTKNLQLEIKQSREEQKKMLLELEGLRENTGDGARPSASGMLKTTNGKGNKRNISGDSQDNQNNYEVDEMIAFKGTTEDKDPVPWFGRVVVSKPLKVRWYDKKTDDDTYQEEVDSDGVPLKDEFISAKDVVCTVNFNDDMTLAQEEHLRVFGMPQFSAN
ncbi:uncharacterized protein LOC118403262 [Branchiostoma floridae]|uniref:Uncharacterized protein LOC118403262 n=1 Tax=Branchiostoma floridae TaxID=7739 RepID=A0A9J7HGD5_BRAFL|nr:uncharacterized protein LOC118403262 [Branchiostoma floridae]